MKFGMHWCAFVLLALCSVTSASDRFVAPWGSDDGQGTLREPYKTLTHGLKIASREPGSTLVLLPGVYSTHLEEHRSGDWQLADVGEGPVTIRARTSGTVVITGAFQPRLRWDVVDAERGIYRCRSSLRELFGPAAYAAYTLRRARPPGAPLWGFDEDGYSLIGYSRYEDFAAGSERYQGGGDLPLYVGPGVFVHKDEVLVRLKPTRLQAQLGFNRSRDPNRRTLRIFDATDRLFLRRVTGLRFEGLRFEAMGRIELSDAQDVSFSQVRTLIPSGNGQASVMIQPTCSDLTFEQMHLRGGLAPWTYRSDIKQGPNVNGLGQAFLLHGSALSTAYREATPGPFRVRVLDSLIEDAFCGVNFLDGAELEVSGCLIRDVSGDGIQIGKSAYQVELHRNWIHAHNGITQVAGNLRPNPFLGSVYVHHNLIQSQVVPMGRDPRIGVDRLYSGPANNQSDKDDDGFAENMVLGARLAGADPWMVYNNTLLTGTQLPSGSGALWLRSDSPVASRFLNNILVQRNPLGVVMKEVRLDSAPDRGAQIADGNVYWRDPHGRLPVLVHRSSSAFFHLFRDGRRALDYSSWEEFRYGAGFERTFGFYPPGFDASSICADPRLDAGYRPSLGSPALQRSLDLSGEYPDWPENDAPFVGAFPSSDQNQSWRVSLRVFSPNWESLKHLRMQPRGLRDRLARLISPSLNWSVVCGGSPSELKQMERAVDRALYEARPPRARSAGEAVFLEERTRLRIAPLVRDQVQVILLPPLPGRSHSALAFVEARPLSEAPPLLIWPR